MSRQIQLQLGKNPSVRIRGQPLGPQKVKGYLNGRSMSLRKVFHLSCFEGRLNAIAEIASSCTEALSNLVLSGHGGMVAQKAAPTLPDNLLGLLLWKPTCNVGRDLSPNF